LDTAASPSILFILISLLLSQFQLCLMIVRNALSSLKRTISVVLYFSWSSPLLVRAKHNKALVSAILFMVQETSVFI
jgi:hypothetical protein